MVLAALAPDDDALKLLNIRSSNYGRAPTTALSASCCPTLSAPPVFRKCSDWVADWTGQRVDSKIIHWRRRIYRMVEGPRRDPHDKRLIISDSLMSMKSRPPRYFGGTLPSGVTVGDFRSAADFNDPKKWTAGRRIRFSAGWELC